MCVVKISFNHTLKTLSGFINHCCFGSAGFPMVKGLVNTAWFVRGKVDLPIFVVLSKINCLLSIIIGKKMSQIN